MTHVLPPHPLMQAAAAADLLNCCSLIVGHLSSAGDRIADGTAGGAIFDELAEEAAEAAEELLAQHLSLAGALSAVPGERAQRLQQALPAVERVAAVVRQHQALRELARARQLELARAAAGRSCAHFCCSNLQARGGPAAKRGTGNLLCRLVGSFAFGWHGAVRACG